MDRGRDEKSRLREPRRPGHERRVASRPREEARRHRGTAADGSRVPLEPHLVVGRPGRRRHRPRGGATARGLPDPLPPPHRLRGDRAAPARPRPRPLRGRGRGPRRPAPPRRHRQPRASRRPRSPRHRRRHGDDHDRAAPRAAVPRGDGRGLRGHRVAGGAPDDRAPGRPRARHRPADVRLPRREPAAGASRRCRSVRAGLRRPLRRADPHRAVRRRPVRAGAAAPGGPHAARPARRPGHRRRTPVDRAPRLGPDADPRDVRLQHHVGSPVGGPGLLGAGASRESTRSASGCSPRPPPSAASAPCWPTARSSAVSRWRDS